MLRNLPIILGIVLIVGLTIVEARMSHRFESTNFEAEQFAELMKLLPNQVGDWVGEDLEVEEVVRRTAGAIGYVSRSYRNSKTGEDVNLWLIVGHSRDVCRHTPNVCYASSGFKVRAENNSLQSIDVPGQPPAEFWTNTFLKEDASGRDLVRVFWAWYKPEAGETEVTWQAPEYPKWEFGNSRALFKMYFTDEMRDPNETTDRSACLRFANVFLPVVNQALVKIENEAAGGVAPAAPAEAPAETPAAAEPAETTG